MDNNRGWEYLISYGNPDFDFDPDNDGSWGTFNEDGSGSYYGADGSWGTFNEDGSGSYYGADGSWGSRNPDGSVSYYGADGSRGSVDENGRGTFYDKSGNITKIESNYEEYECFDDNDEDNDDDYEPTEPLNPIGVAAAAVGIGILANMSNTNSSKESESISYRRMLKEDEKHEIRLRKKHLRIERKEAHRRERREIVRKHWKGLIIFLMLVCLCSFAGYKYYEYKTTIPVGIASGDLIGKDYREVVRLLKTAGFEYVYDYPEMDLEYKDRNLENKVINVTIEDDRVFDSKSRYPYDAHVRVRYHTLENIIFPASSKEIKKIKIQDLEKKLRTAGFVNVSKKAESGRFFGSVIKKDKIKNITIDGEEYDGEKTYFRPDSEIIITYYSNSK